jgi:hypothetical protein
LVKDEEVTRLLTDDHVAALRAMLTENLDEYERVTERMVRTNATDGFNVLIAAAFHRAIIDRFKNGYTSVDIIRFVADERTRFDDSHGDFDPRVAEQLIRAALGDGSAEGMDEEAKARAQFTLLMGLVDDAQLDDAGLDKFMTEVLKIADATVSQFQVAERSRDDSAATRPPADQDAAGVGPDITDAEIMRQARR